MKNRYEIRGSITVIFIDRRGGSVLEALVSTADLPCAESMPGKWCAGWCEGSQTYYVSTTVRENGKRRRYQLHTVICNTPPGMTVDHRNHNALDNTWENLRVVTQAVNNLNRRGPMRNNKSSGIRGVCWHKSYNKWQAIIKRKFLGFFDVKEEAAAAVDEELKRLRLLEEGN